MLTRRQNIGKEMILASLLHAVKKSLEKKHLRIPASIGLRSLGFCSKLFVRIKASKKKKQA